MALYVQLEDDAGEPLWHRNAGFVDVPATEERSASRVFTTGCGEEQEAAPERLNEADTDPWTNRCTEAGCFDTAADDLEE